MSDNSPLEEPPAQQKRSIVHGRPFQFAAIGVAGLAIGGFIGLGTGFAAGAFFGGGHGHHRDHGDNERFRDQRDDRPRQYQVPGKPIPGKPLPGQPLPGKPVPSSPGQ